MLTGHIRSDSEILSRFFQSYRIGWGLNCWRLLEIHANYFRLGWETEKNRGIIQRQWWERFSLKEAEPGDVTESRDGRQPIMMTSSHVMLKNTFLLPPLFVCLVMYNFKAKKVRAIIVGLMDRFGYQCNDSCMISAWFMQLSSMILGSKRHFRILSLVINRLHYVVNDLSVKRIDSGNFSVR